uniref:Glutaredoxin domain-containing protein n=1 Tax=Macrostomum lignano TaxID=282301 RepID=A0A1I8FNZ6_9PLAT
PTPRAQRTHSTKALTGRPPRNWRLPLDVSSQASRTCPAGIRLARREGRRAQQLGASDRSLAGSAAAPSRPPYGWAVSHSFAYGATTASTHLGETDSRGVKIQSHTPRHPTCSRTKTGSSCRLSPSRCSSDTLSCSTASAGRSRHISSAEQCLIVLAASNMSSGLADAASSLRHKSKVSGLPRSGRTGRSQHHFPFILQLASSTSDPFAWKLHGHQHRCRRTAHRFWNNFGQGQNSPSATVSSSSSSLVTQRTSRWVSAVCCEALKTSRRLRLPEGTLVAAVGRHRKVPGLTNDSDSGAAMQYSLAAGSSRAASGSGRRLSFAAASRRVFVCLRLVAARRRTPPPRSSDSSTKVFARTDRQVRQRSGGILRQPKGQRRRGIPVTCGMSCSPRQKVMKARPCRRRRRNIIVAPRCRVEALLAPLAVMHCSSRRPGAVSMFVRQPERQAAWPSAAALRWALNDLRAVIAIGVLAAVSELDTGKMAYKDKLIVRFFPAGGGACG